MAEKKEFLDKKTILKTEDKDFKVIDVPEWGGKVRIASLSGEDRDKFESALIKFKNFGKKNQSAELVQNNIRARLAAYTVVDENGKRIFSDSDIPALGKKSAKALDRIFPVAQELSGITDEDVEELTKN